MKCLNENCLLNKNKKCDNPVVLEGKAPCYGKVRTQKKEKTKGWNNSTKKAAMINEDFEKAVKEMEKR